MVVLSGFSDGARIIIIISKGVKRGGATTCLGIGQYNFSTLRLYVIRAIRVYIRGHHIILLGGINGRCVHAAVFGCFHCVFGHGSEDNSHAREVSSVPRPPGACHLQFYNKYYAHKTNGFAASESAPDRFYARVSARQEHAS